MKDTKTQKPKRKQRVIKVYALPEEYEVILENAKAAGLDLSVFLRRVGAGIPVSSAIDRTQIVELSKVNADLGRLGGLLKLWLTDQEKRSGMEMDIRQVLRDIEVLMGEMKDALKRL